MIIIRKQYEQSQHFGSISDTIFATAMKFIAVTIFVLLLFAQTFSKWLVVLEYAINKEYIAKNLCENRNNIESNCKGKCQLSKKMGAEEKSNSKAASGNPLAKHTVSEILYSNETRLDSLQNDVLNMPDFGSFYLVKKCTAPSSAIFHPPLV